MVKGKVNEQDRKLLFKAGEASQKAYAPYSNYKVGAAVLWDSGLITHGCNVENASYGLACCAERNAIFQGVALGERKIVAVAIAVREGGMPYPCGACRQVMKEFSDDCDIIISNGVQDPLKTSLGFLLPNSFGPQFLSNS
ncbi:MAG: cytidine deaminase [Desulfitobacteriia bacterium]|jgi:cytidine deaminase